MESTVRKQNGITVVELEGELDIYSTTALKAIIKDQLGGGSKRMLLDLKDVGYVDSAALGVLVGGLKRAKEVSAELKLSNINGPVAKIFKLTKLSEFFDIYNSSDEAIESFTTN